MWEDLDPELVRTILAGVDEAERGETLDLGSFTQYLDDEDEEADETGDTKLDLPPTDAGHRRVLAVLTWLGNR